MLIGPPLLPVKQQKWGLPHLCISGGFCGLELGPLHNGVFWTLEHDQWNQNFRGGVELECG